MKKLLLILISAIATFAVSAQTNSTAVNKVYVEFGGGSAGKNGVGGTFGAKFVIKEKWTASFSYHSLSMDPKNLPSDYQQGYVIFLIFPIPDPMPSQQMNTINFTGGRLFQMGRKTWFTTEAGFSIVSGKTFHFTPRKIEENWDYVSSNYYTSEESKTTIGAMVRTDFTWAFCPYVGLDLGAFANMNSVQSPVGFEFKLVAGWLNTKKHHTK